MTKRTTKNNSKFSHLLSVEKGGKGERSLVPLEWAVLAYMLFTTILICIMFTRLHAPSEMLMFRARVLVVMMAMWGLYRLMPCPLMMFIRIALQMVFLADWYPDTYEFNRCFENLDHIFCSLEQTVFGCQPAIEFSRHLPWGFVSEPLDLGYVSYYPIIFFTALFYFLYRRADFQKSVFIVMSSFFMFYVIFIFLPVAGPTFYYKAVGLDIIEQGVFPSIGHYFENHRDLAGDCLPSPGWTDGPMWYLVEVAKWAGERPTAAFPSSHVGVTTVCMWLLWHTRNRRVFLYVLPLAVLMFFATFYIQAHYAIDAIAGVVVGTLFYFVLNFMYGRLFSSRA